MTIRAAPVTADDTFTQEVSAALAAEYRILGLLDRRPGAAVYLAHRAKDTSDFPLALHVIRRDPGDPMHTRLVRALEVTASLEHPNVLPIRPLREVGGFMFAEGRLATGGTLEALMEQNGKLPLDRVFTILAETAAALDHAHAQGVVHGALHAGAVGFDAEGRVLLGGFLLASGGPDDPALQPSEVAHPAYVSHEQRYDQRGLDGRTDQYALAVLAWELLTGVRRANYDEDGVLQVDPLDVSPSRALREEAGLNASLAIRRALSKEPAVRFESCSEFIDALSGKEVVGPQGLPTYHPPLAREQRSVVWLVLPVVAILIIATIALYPQESRNAAIAGWQRISGQVSKSGGAIPIPEAPTPEPGGEETGTSAGSTTFRPPEQERPAEDRGGTATSAPTPVSSAPADAGPETGSGGGRRTTVGGAPSGGAPTRPGGSGVTPAQAATLPPRDTTASARGTAFVTLDGGRAAVTVNGIPRGFTPAAIALGRGRHVIRLVGTRTTPDSVVVSIAGGDSTRATFRVRP